MPNDRIPPFMHLLATAGMANDQAIEMCDVGCGFGGLLGACLVGHIIRLKCWIYYIGNNICPRPLYSCIFISLATLVVYTTILIPFGVIVMQISVLILFSLAGLVVYSADLLSINCISARAFFPVSVHNRWPFIMSMLEPKHKPGPFKFENIISSIFCQ